MAYLGHGKSNILCNLKGMESQIFYVTLRVLHRIFDFTWEKCILT